MIFFLDSLIYVSTPHNAYYWLKKEIFLNDLNIVLKESSEIIKQCLNSLSKKVNSSKRKNISTLKILMILLLNYLHIA
jgi:hypothetical protein